MNNYDHKTIEQKWQKEWEEKGIYKTSDDESIKKHYILDMFPYPSGEGLHVGHPRGYIATDVYSRKKRMEGFNVLHPMGWDAFGLPAENFAIKNKVHPSVAVDKNVARFKEQLSLIGLDHDWSREINTTDPEFYKWTQWTFLQFFKKGLAYESNEPVNWCPTDKTVLANEDVEPDGTCERCGTKVEKKPMRQWVLKITDYADRMLADLDKLPKWPEGVKEAQRNWIGKSEGSEIEFKVKNRDEKIKVFTTRADTLFGATYVVLAPEHSLVNALLRDISNTDEIKKYIDEVKNKTEEERTNIKKEKTGVELKGIKAINPANNEEVSVWIADYVLAGYGTGAIMAVPAHDERDFEFAEKYSIKMRSVIYPEMIAVQPNQTKEEVIQEYLDCKKPYISEGHLINSSSYNDLAPFFARKKITEAVDGKMVSTYRIKDWVFSRQRYWGEPIPIIHCEKCGVVPVPEKDLPVLLPEVEHYEPTGTGESPLAAISEWVNVKCPTCGDDAKRETNTMPQWAGSSWYYLRYIDPKNSVALIDVQKEKTWMPVDVYVGGDHATRHLIYARFWHKFLFDIGVVSTEEPFPRLEFLGFILAEDGRKMSKRWKNVVNPDDVIKQFGADAFRLYEMFIGPFESTVPWNANGLVGTYRFIEKVWALAEKDFSAKTEGALESLLHKTIKKVTEDIENFKFNIAISTFMIFVNEATKKELSKGDFKLFLQLLAPFAPHIAEELWTELGETTSIHLSSWPIWDEKFIQDTELKIVIQINGKLKGEMIIGLNEAEDDIKKKALTNEAILKITLGKEPQRIVYVKDRLINIVL